MKKDSRKPDTFDLLKQRLEESGVINKHNKQGNVIYYNEAKGYGFIMVDGVKHFMHISAYGGGGYPYRGQALRVMVDNKKRVVSAHRIASEGTESASKGC